MTLNLPPFATLESPKWYLRVRLYFLGFENKEIDDFFVWCDNNDIDIETFCELDQKQIFFRYLTEAE